MIGFVFGVLVGFGVKMAYDFVQEERIPTDLGMAQGRNEAILDETRQIVRELRDDVRRMIGSATAGDGGGARSGRGMSRQESGPGAMTSQT
jgi:hypothetical protein